MTINIGYNTYKFWNCSTGKIEVSSDTLDKLGLSPTLKYTFKDYDSIVELIAIKHKMTVDAVYGCKSNTTGFN